ncbi:pre-mRNA-splicing factor CWF7, putative [Plasmodium malariae]|uniref:Pre-mRNA-splicing factor CWF7, putative n=1 Tax=Plasmodium malariae TaxID=5858 RepID=A0A1C3KZU5_PLAMA|nr:pre-mRNA-splicing factor CWF7, putative [Plasmodium malariae]
MEIHKEASDEEKDDNNNLVEVNNDSLANSSNGKEKNKKLYETIDLHHLVNALPYIDSYDNEFEQNAKKMVEEEMNLMNKKKEIKNYLKNFPVPQSVYVNNENSIVQNELNRCEQNKKMDKLNLEYYNIENDILNDNKDIEEWKKTLKKHELILENLHNALINMELMSKYKEVMWCEHMKVFTHIDINLQNNIKTLKEEIDNINKQRKLHQLSYVNDLSTLQNERKEFKRKNSLVINEIKKLSHENMLMQYKRNII